MDDIENDTPPMLNLWLENALKKRCRSENNSYKHSLVQKSISQVILKAGAPQDYISPLLFAIGLFLYKETGKRVVVDVLHQLGLCESYSNIEAFQRSAALISDEESFPVDAFIQWVGDNFDHGEDTLDGKNTTHQMGIISCVTPPVKNIDRKIPRIRPSAKDILLKGNFNSLVKHYKPPIKKCKTHNVKVVPLALKGSYDFRKMYYRDYLWTIGMQVNSKFPNWQGFMSSYTKGGVCELTTVIFNPMIPLNPDTDDSVYSTICFVKEAANKAKQCCYVLTFDCPLYMRAYRIKTNTCEFNKLFLRLGGFHTVMSSLGSIYKFMEGSGLE